MTYRAALFSILLLLPSAVSADTVRDDKIKMHTDALVKDLTCGIITEFGIRDVHLFAAQMELLQPTTNDKKTITKEMFAILNGFKADLVYQVEQLLQHGVDKTDVDQLIEETSEKVHQKYIGLYMRSIDIDAAQEAIAITISEQSECSKWFMEEILPKLRERSGEING